MAVVDGLPPKQAALLIQLLGAPSLPVAAKRAGIPERTAYRMLADPGFAAAYREAQRQARSVAAGLGAVLTGAAMATLQALLVDPEVAPAVRLSAAKTILETDAKRAASDDLETRIAALEGGRAADGTA